MISNSIATLIVLSLINTNIVKASKVSLYGQCGGINYTGATECVEGATCVSQNPYYYQCTTGVTTTATATATTTTGKATTSTTKSTDSASKVSLYGQCGGINYEGATECVEGATCVSQNPYYYQCTTGVSTVETKTKTSTSTTPTTTLVTSVKTSSTSTSKTTSSAKTSTLKTTAKTSATSTSKTTAKTSTTAATSTSKSTSKTTTSTSVSKTSTSSTSTATSEAIKVISGGFSGTGVTTRYWDCCLPSYSWNGKSSSVPDGQTVRACNANGDVFSGYSFSSGCNGGDAFMCNDQVAWSLNDSLAYGFAAASIEGSSDETLACSCMKLTFTSTSISGKEMIVQITNTGGDLSGNHFDLAFPGGGVGYYTQGCSNEFGSGYSWGETYGGVSSESECSGLPSELQSACDFRFEWFEGADNPNVSFEQVVCPEAIVAVSGCQRTDE